MTYHSSFFFDKTTLIHLVILNSSAAAAPMNTYNEIISLQPLSIQIHIYNYRSNILFIFPCKKTDVQTIFYYFISDGVWKILRETESARKKIESEIDRMYTNNFTP